MVTSNLEDTRLKNILKQALLEVLEERQDVLVSLLQDVLEDMGLLQAIKRGEESETIERLTDK